MNCDESCVLNLSVEVEFAGDMDGELQDVIIRHLTDELILEQLKGKIKGWAEKNTGQISHVCINVE